MNPTGRFLLVGIWFLALAPSAAAKKKALNWQDAVVIKITSEQRGAAAIPVGGIVAAVPIIKTFYWIETPGLIYVVGPTHRLDVTLHGKTKVAIEGRSAHILDDAGKDRKLPIFEKIARNEQTSKPQ